MPLTPGRLIALARRERRITQADLAARLGIGRRTLSRWENDRAQPPLAMLGPLCDALDIESAAFALLPSRDWRRFLR